MSGWPLTSVNTNINRHTHTHTHTHNHSLSLTTGFAVVHMMLDDARRRYELEKLWTLGPRYDDQLLSMHAHAQHSTDFSLYYAKS